MSKLRITSNARAIIQELIALHEEFIDYTRVIANDHTPNHVAVDAGADREAVRAQILGAAWRLVKEVKGWSA